jgi:homoserine kinase
MPHLTLKVPASTANLGCAFDIAGLALGVYNTYVFAKSPRDVLAGFAEADSGEDNLVLTSYHYAQQALGLPTDGVKIRLLECNIPYSSGLGSSAACIVAGVVAAAKLGGSAADSRRLLDVMTAIEGHPDNVAPAYLGGLTVNLADGADVVSYHLPVSRSLCFTALIPPFSFATKEARRVVPVTMDRATAIHNAARTALLPVALGTGDVDMLKKVFDDRWHQPYRLPLIEGASAIKAALEAKGFAVALSGAGPTLLAVGERYVTAKDIDVSWKIMPLTVADGATSI